MTWFEDMRLLWIGEMLDIYGFINRKHLMLKFGISKPQASTDLRRFQKRFPDRMTYNVGLKTYVRRRQTDGK